jgi:hypothetical protein
MRGLMKKLLPVAVGAAMGCAASTAAAETGELKLKKTDDVPHLGSSSMYNMLRYVSEQNFWTDLSAERPDMDEQFRKAVKKQPEKYQTERPFRCVARFGKGEYGLVFDSTDLTKKGFNRLHFDRNGNGDLTDDEVIKAKTSTVMQWNNAVQTEFPTLTVPIKADGSEYEYSFTVNTQAYGQSPNRWVQASIRAAVYRDGEITLEGQKRHICLVDFNSNGRFDDAYKVNTEVQSSDGRIWPTDGDILLVDPEKMPANINWYDSTVNDRRLYVSKVVNIDGKFFDLAIAPAGDKLTLTASKAAVGHIVNPNAEYNAIVYNDGGLLRIHGTRNSPVALPEGQWRLLSYSIDLTNASQPASQPTTQKTARKGGLLRRLVASVVGIDEASGPKTTMVSASATKDYKPVTVKKGQTTELAFGPPYKPTVRVEEWRRQPNAAELSMALIGSVGEVCTDLQVKGSRPESPTFAITAPDGEIVERGKFEYG